MADAPPSTLTRTLEAAFADAVDAVVAATVAALKERALAASALPGQPELYGGGPDLAEQARVDLRLGIDGSELQWIARLEAGVRDSETLVSAGHWLLRDGSETGGWQRSTTVKTETSDERPELREAATTLLRELASDVAIAEALKTFNLDPSNLPGGADPRQQYPDAEQNRAPSPPSAEAIELSASVRSVGRAVADRGAVTAVDVARALRDIHPEYAGGQFGLHELADGPSDAVALPWEAWIENVRALFDPEAIARTEEVIDGRLLLAALGTLDPRLSAQLDAAGVWAQLLIEIDGAAIAGIPSLVEAKAGVALAHGYRNDDPEGPDLLGIEGEINAVCEVVTDPAVRPPLAIGLFGEWGSGKSFFMEKMRHRIDFLGRSRPDPAAPNAEVAQIRFNAWHYSDSNLWASLAVEIFERLADPEPVPPEEFDRWLKEQGDNRRQARGKLLTQLESFREAKANLDAEEMRLREKRQQVATEIATVEQRRTKAIEEASLGDVVARLGEDSTVIAARDEIAERLGISPAVTEWKEVASELRTSSGYAANVWRLVSNKPLALLGVATALAALAVVPALLDSAEQWVARSAAAVAAAGSLGGTLLAFVRPAAARVNAALASVERGIQRADAVEGGLRAKYDQRVRVLDAELRSSDAALTEIRDRMGRIDAQIEEVERRAHDLSVGRQLYDFLSSRASDYRSQQGVIGMLHRDFRLLDAKLRALADGEPIEGEEGDETGRALRPIRRVVLYIDDLDRCAPPKVLEVLQAVHLLLALELFIVVVGVDPRWLNRSLRHEYRDLAGVGIDGDDSYMRLLPIQYLEKIFQVPLTLPKMADDGYQQLIAGLAPGVDVSRGPAKELGEDERAPAVGAAMPPTPRGGHSAGEAREAPRRALLTPQAGSAAAGSGGRRIDLTPDELGFAQRLGGLVETPRAAKRLLNIYRLVRATQAIGSGSQFLGADRQPGEFYAVQTLLAVAAGFPAETDDLLVALQHAGGRLEAGERGAVRSWSEFVGRLVPRPLERDGGSVEGVIVTDATGEIAGDLAQWHQLHAGLAGTLRYNPLGDLAPYVEWGPKVARFSFTL
jgi:hypothetical protein